MTKEEKELFLKLKRALKGRLKEIADEQGVNPSTVTRVLSGDFSSPKILHACIEKAAKMKKERNKLERQISQVL